MLELFGLADHSVQIGISHLTLQSHHGTPTTTQGRFPFVVDRPGKLKRPRPSTVESIFKQFEKLGAPATEVEVSVGNRRRVYRIENGQPKLITQSFSA